MIDKTLFKIITIVSILTGAILGLASVIPFLTFFVMLVLMLLMAPFVIIYFKNLNLIDKVEAEQYMIIGAISGFMGVIGFSIIFFPSAFLVDAIFKIGSLLWAKVIIQNFVFFIGFVFFLGLLSALFNAFSGFLTGYFYRFFNKKR